MMAFTLRPLIFLLLFLSNSNALSPETRLPQESQEQRAMNLFLQVRCLICGGQVIENSDSEFSFEMRKLIRQKIAAGQSDEEIKAGLVAEFGEDILTSVNAGRGVNFLWILPVVFMLVFALSFPFFSRHASASGNPEV